MNWRASAILKAGLVALAFMATDKVHAECPKWTLTSDEINIGQSNNTELFVTFQQMGARLGGTAQYRNTSGKMGRGLVSGKLQGSTISFQIAWQDGSRAHYRGAVSSKGRLSGVVEDASNPMPPARWASHSRQAACMTLVATAERQTQCPPGYDRRDLLPGDDACVTPAERIRVSR